METVTETPVETPQPLASVSRKPRPKHLFPAFTPDNAGEFARKATIAREHNRRARAAALSPEAYVELRLARVRAQLQKLDAMIDTELDPQKLDRLVCAQNRLSEQWRIFSGIPLPGSRRPGRESSKDKPQLFEPSE